MIDATHDMYLPRRRARAFTRCTPPAPRLTVQQENEAWMRKRQAEKAAAGDDYIRPARIEAVIKLACTEYEITRAQFFQVPRSRSIKAARGFACRELRKLNMHYKEIARVLGFRHHTSVMHHCKEMQPGTTDPTTRPVEPSFNPDLPDLSGEWNI